MACVQEGREVKVSTVRRAAGALHEAKCITNGLEALFMGIDRYFTVFMI